MAEYIKREKVLALAKDICVPTKWGTEYRHRSIDPMDVRELPAADVRPVVRGEWCARNGLIENALLDINEFFQCSECGYRRTTRTRFCQNCGAQMEGGHESP